MKTTILQITATLDGEPLDPRDMLDKLTRFFTSRGKIVSRSLGRLEVTSPQDPGQKIQFQLIEFEQVRRAGR